MKIQFTVGELEEPVTIRTRDGYSANLTARRDIGRYYEVLRYALAGLSMSEGEASLIADALNGVWMADIQTPSQARAHLVMEVTDHVRLNGAAKKWGVDGDKMSALLSGLTDIEAIALIDAVERLWINGELTVADVGLVA